VRQAANAVVETLENRIFFDALPSYITPSPGAAYTFNSTSGALSLTSGTLFFTADVDPTCSQSVSLVNLAASGSSSHVCFNSDEHIAGLSLTSGASAIEGASSQDFHDVLVIGTENESTAPTFTISGTSKLDLENNDMIVHGGNTTTDLAAVQAAAAVGRNVAPGGIFDGTWNGDGLTSSVAAAIDASVHAEQNILAVELNGDRFLGKLGNWTVGTFSEPLRSNGNDVLVKDTTNGDLNLSGSVDDNAVTILGNYHDNGHSLVSQGLDDDYAYGDLNGDGFVDDNDVTILGNFYGTAAPANLGGTGFSAQTGVSTGPVVVARFTGATAAAGTTGASASINFGDGSSPSTVSAVSTGGGNWVVNGNHTYSSSGQYPVIVSVGGGVAGSIATVAAAPTVATAASATQSSDETSASLSVLGADAAGAGEGNLTYTWDTVGTPPAAVSFSANGTNAAKNSTATFTAPGVYDLEATISNGIFSTTSDQTVTVNQILSGNLTIAAGSSSVNEGQTMEFAASGPDQFGNLFNPSGLSWSATGTGTINSSGVYSAPSGPGSATITASLGSYTGCPARRNLWRKAA
jgi:hypothetical protein